MTVVNLDQIGTDFSHRKKAIRWLVNQYGPVSEGRWSIDKDLTSIEFAEGKDATFFILRWT